MEIYLQSEGVIFCSRRLQVPLKCSSITWRDRPKPSSSFLSHTFLPEFNALFALQIEAVVEDPQGQLDLALSSLMQSHAGASRHAA